ncbi:MAG: ATP-dependent DNA helicase [Candidatus Nezhaarchaeales archaeon]
MEGSPWEKVSSDKPWVFFFPYDVARRGQVLFADTVYNAIQRGISVIINAPSGFGKTVAALAALLPFVKGGRRVIWAARTHREAERVIEELKLINAKYSADVNAVAVRGRVEMCPLISSGYDNDDAAFYCRETRAVRGCQYYKRFLEFKAPERWCMTGGEVYSYALSFNACPYFVQRSLVRQSQVVAMSYQLAFQGIQTYLKEVEASTAVMVVDEVHNLPELLRSITSDRLTLRSIEGAAKEAEGKPMLQRFCHALMEVVKGYGDHEQLVTFDELSLRLKAEGAPRIPLSMVAEVAVFEGNLVRKALLMEGKRPKSSLHSLGLFLKLITSGRYTLIVGGGVLQALKLEVVRPEADIIGFSATADAQLAEELNLEYIDLSVAPTPSAEVFCLNDVTTAYEEREPNYKKYVEWLKLMPKRTGIFAASFKVLNGLLNAGVGSALSPLFVEREGMTSRENEELLRGFKEVAGYYLGVLGGRTAEGVDFPGLIRIVFIVGVPFEEPSVRLEALIRYYRELYGDERRAKLTAYVMPAVRKVVQAAGRAFRSPEDRGIVVLGDKRFVTLKRLLPRWLKSFKQINYEERQKLAVTIEEVLKIKSL